MAGKKSKLGKRFKLEKPDKPIKLKSTDNSGASVVENGKSTDELGWLIAGLANAARAVRTELSSALGRLDLYAGQEQVILALDGQQGCTLGELAERVGVRPPTVTKTISRMEGRGFVQRVASQTDARVVLVHLTDKGQAMAVQLRQLIATIEGRVVGDMKKSERKALAKGLAAVNARFNDTV